MKETEVLDMMNLVPYTTKCTADRIWDPFREFFGTVVHSAATDIQDKGDSFVIETELPGYDKSEISVDLKENVLTIHAEHQAETKPDEGYVRRERTWETVDRSFEVTGIDAAAIQAAYTNGVLTVTLPKLPEVIPEQHQIQVQ